MNKSAEHLKQRWAKIRAGELPPPGATPRAGKYTTTQTYIVDDSRPPKKLRIEIRNEILTIKPLHAKGDDAIQVSIQDLYVWLKRRKMLGKGT